MADKMRETVTTKPDPDPTVMTTQQLQREVAAIKELMVTRNEGYDKAIALLQSRADKSPSIDVVDTNLKALAATVETRFEANEKLTVEKFRRIDTQIAERDTRTEQTSRDSKVAVDAAFAAAKEAVGEQNKSNATANSKMEASFTKQLNLLAGTLASVVKNVDDKIDDLKTRLTTMEGRREGVGLSAGVVVGAMGILIGVGGLAAAFLR